MLLTVKSSSATHSTDPLNLSPNMADEDPRDDGSDDDDTGKGGSKGKSRRELPAGAVATLKAWLLSPEHFTHPYPTPQDQVMLMQKTGIDKKQLKNWFTNARRRIWKPMLKKQIEHGNLNATAAAGGTGPGVPGMMIQAMPSGMDDNSQFQQQQQQQVHHAPAPDMRQQVQVDQFGNAVYAQAPTSFSAAPAPVAQAQYYDPNANGAMHVTNSIGSLPMMSQSGSGQQLSKSDSHAVLMELFARDQDLVRQATESAGLHNSAQDNQHAQQSLSRSLAPAPGQGISSQHPMMTLSQSRPSMSSWPHFSSVSSLNNLGTMPGVRSITSLSGADLAKQGPVNTIGNLAQVKSVESMGKSDSYAFLEVFFGDRSSNNLSQMWGKESGRGVKRDREEDNDVGLSLEDETSPSMPTHRKESSNGMHQTSEPSPSPFNTSKNSNDSNDTLKRAYDDALAARGLISVSRSCEKLTDLALPDRMQRTLSQEFFRQHHQQQQQQHQQQQQQQNHMGQGHQNQSHMNQGHQNQSHMNQNQQSQSHVNQAQSHMNQGHQNHQMYSQFQFSSTPAPSDSGTASQQYPGQHPRQHPGQPMQSMSEERNSQYSSHPNDTNASVEVPSATKCAICHQTNVDTQLRPCGHMFHERCLKPSLQAPMGPPKCPVDHIPIQSALLAVPTDEGSMTRNIQPSWNTAVTSGQSFSASTQH